MISQSSRWSYICMHKVYVGIQKINKDIGWRPARNYLFNACPLLENLFFIDRNRLDEMFHSVQYNLFIRMEKMSRFQTLTPCKRKKKGNPCIRQSINYHWMMRPKVLLMILRIIINQIFTCGHLIWALHQRMKRGFLPNGLNCQVVRIMNYLIHVCYWAAWYPEGQINKEGTFNHRWCMTNRNKHTCQTQ